MNTTDFTVRGVGFNLQEALEMGREGGCNKEIVGYVVNMYLKANLV